MKRLLLIAALLLASSAAHAEQWYYVNVGDGVSESSAPCTALKGDKGPVSAMSAVVDPQTIRTDRDMTLAGGSRLMILSANDHKYAFATTVKTCTSLRTQITQQAADDAAGANRWYIAQYRGDCVPLSEAFSGVSTSEALHKAMTKNGAQLSLDRRGDDVALLVDDSGHYPPMVMVRGLTQCEASGVALIGSQNLPHSTMESEMPTSTSKERSDMYEYDFQDPRNGASEAYWKSVMPEQVKKAIAKRRATAADSLSVAPDEGQKFTEQDETG